MKAGILVLTGIVAGRTAGALIDAVLARRRVRTLGPIGRDATPPRVDRLLTSMRRRRGAGEQLPEALDAVARSLRSGGTIAAAIADGAAAVAEPLASDLARVAARAKTDGVVAALEDWERDCADPAVRTAVAALVLSARSGGAPARAVDGAAASVRAHYAIAAEVRALSSQARLSAVVIGVAPVAFASLASVTDASIASVLFGTPLGAVLLASGLGLDVAGGLWMARICRPSRPSGDGAAAEEQLPEVIDLFAVAVGAGLTVRLAVEAVAERAGDPIGAELRRTLDRCARGLLLADALSELPRRAGEAVRPLAGALADADRYGSPLGPALDRLAAEAREQRRRRAEERARRVPVLLLFPLVLCILPAFGLLTVAPLLAGALQALDV